MRQKGRSGLGDPQTRSDKRGQAWAAAEGPSSGWHSTSWAGASVCLPRRVWEILDKKDLNLLPLLGCISLLC